MLMEDQPKQLVIKFNWMDGLAIFFPLLGFALPIAAAFLIPDRTSDGANWAKLSWIIFSLIVGAFWVLIGFVMSILSVNRYGFREFNSLIFALNAIICAVATVGVSWYVLTMWP
jgi:hypothetical protein